MRKQRRVTIRHSAEEKKQFNEACKILAEGLEKLRKKKEGK